MTQAKSKPSPLSGILAVLIAALHSDISTIILKLLPFIGQWFKHTPEGIYEVLGYEAQLELCDPKGEIAIYSKRQRVRFLQDNVIAYQDQAWGEGDIFADYRCSPGVPVDRYQEGYRYRILISLRQTKNRGDIEEFHIERHIKGGFTKAAGSFQTNVDHRTQQLSLSVVFPSQRKPFEVLLVEQHADRTTVLGAEHIRRLPNGNWFLDWGTGKPKQYESYILHWKW